MSEVVKPAEVTPGAVAPPATTPAQPVAPAPANTTVPAPSPASNPAPAPVAPAAPAPGSPAPAPTEQLLVDLPPKKPTVDAIKVPEGFVYPKERLETIISSAKSVEEAQGRVDLIHSERQRDIEFMKSQNTNWIQGLKADPEFGGAKWEESKALYKKGIIQDYGEEFAKALVDAHLDGRPELFKATVRKMRVMEPKPVVSGAPPEPPKKVTDPWDKVYSPTNGAPNTPRPTW